MTCRMQKSQGNCGLDWNETICVIDCDMSYVHSKDVQRQWVPLHANFLSFRICMLLKSTVNTCTAPN